MPFEKGTSGNPDGRPRKPRVRVPTDKELNDYSQTQLMKTLKKLAAIRDAENLDNNTIIKVSCKILDVSYNLRVDRLEYEKEMREAVEAKKAAKKAARQKRREEKGIGSPSVTSNVKPLFSSKAIVN